MSRIPLRLLLLSGLLILVPGCHSMSLVRGFPGLPKRSHAETQVSRILCLWEPSEGIGVDGKPTRGFAGQVLFFGPGEKSAVRVNGVVRIAEYADFDPEQEDLTPLHTFEFAAEAWDAHRTDGSLGHSYNVFIPYVQKRRTAVNCALRVEYTAADRRIVASDTTEVMLPARASRGQSPAMKRSVVKGPSGSHSKQSRSDFRSTVENPMPSDSAGPAAKNPLETATIPLPIKNPGPSANESL